MLKKFFLFLLFFESFFTQAQSPYKPLTWANEAVILGGSGVGLGISFSLSSKTKGLTAEQIAALNSDKIPAFDQFSLRHYSIHAQKTSDIFLVSSVALPLFLLADSRIRENAGQTGGLVGETILVNFALTNLVKEIVKRPRPFVYNPNAPMDAKTQRDARKSFFSGHTSTTAAMSFVTAKIWSDYNPDSKWQPAVWAAVVAVPMVTGYLRMKGGKHFLSDVLVGFVVGSATSFLIPELHKIRQ